MTTHEIKTIIFWFENYTHSFSENDGLHRLLQLKVDHSRRVAQDARALAVDLGWSADDCHLAEALGWLHDIGRFSQYQEFRTFHDARSINHGERGAEILEQTSLLSEIPMRERLCLLQGVRWHNARDLPDDLDDGVRPWVKLIRDADKLDIFHVVSREIREDGFQSMSEMFPHVQLDGPVNPAVIQDIQMQRSSSFEQIKSLNDFYIMQLSWIYDISYAPTLRRIVQRQILSDLTDRLPRDHEAVEALVKEVEAFVGSRQ
ncbi:MAG: HD domain-containing protein [Phycisphaerae bacterium]|nr:HD domain-containing protein [Phycisphaerae bacterium]